MMFKCEFPNCGFQSEDRFLYESHHIIPVSMNGENSQRNRILVCRTCHAKIFVPGIEKGIHSTNSPEKIIILGWRLGTGKQKILHYKNYNGEECFY